MRIGIDATPLPSQPVGAGRYIVELINSLSALECSDEIIVYIQEDKVQLLDINPNDHLHIKSIKRKSILTRIVWEQITLPRILKEHKIDLLHSLHYTSPYLLPNQSIITFHDLTFFKFPQEHTFAKRMFFKTSIRLSLRKADAIITVSENTREDVLRISQYPGEKVFSIPLGVGPNFQKIVDEHKLSTVVEKYNLPEKYVLFVGTIEPRKNLEVLLEAHEKIQNDRSPLDLVLVGKLGWKFKDVLKRIENSQYSNRIHRLGYVDYEDLPYLYNLAQVFTYPSLYEGFGLPVLEAMACGTPVITSDASSLPEIVGDAGVLIPPRDVGALQESIWRIMNDEKLRAELSNAGMSRASMYSWENTARKTYEVYRTMADGRETNHN